MVAVNPLVEELGRLSAALEKAGPFEIAALAQRTVQLAVAIITHHSNRIEALDRWARDHSAADAEARYDKAPQL